MPTTKPSLEVAARTARRLRDEAASVFDTSLGDPGPGRSALEQQRTKLLEPAKPISISAAHGGGIGISTSKGIERMLTITVKICETKP